MLTQINHNLFYDERSAGGLVFRHNNQNILWLLIKTIGKNKYRRPIYKFPKGHLLANEFLKAAALREVEEEGRIKAKIIAKIGSNNYVLYDKIQHHKTVKRVTFFLMEYLSDSPLRHFDKEIVLDRQWLAYDDACRLLAYDSEKILLKKAKSKLDSLKI
jgi:8-oxo-dGTP pyrophosphatase MutT (NUDIX family)